MSTKHVFFSIIIHKSMNIQHIICYTFEITSIAFDISIHQSYLISTSIIFTNNSTIQHCNPKSLAAPSPQSQVAGHRTSRPALHSRIRMVRLHSSHQGFNGTSLAASNASVSMGENLEIWLMWWKQCHKPSSKSPFFMGGINHQQMWWFIILFYHISDLGIAENWVPLKSTKINLGPLDPPGSAWIRHGITSITIYKQWLSMGFCEIPDHPWL